MKKIYNFIKENDYVSMDFKEILDIKIQKDQAYPFNLKISGKKNKEQNFITRCEGPGIYFIKEKKTNYLLYIGVHSPEKDTVYEARYFKHISTFSMRGFNIAKQHKGVDVYNLINSNKFLQVLESHFLSKCIGKNNVNQKFLKTLLNCMSEGRPIYKKSVGIQTTLRRIAYANYFWNIFSSQDINSINTNLQNHFSFYYIKFPELVSISEKNRKRFLYMKKNIETPLINYFKPLLNSDSPNKFDFEKNDFSTFNSLLVTKKINELIDNL